MQTETKMTDAENRGPPPPHSNDAATFTPNDRSSAGRHWEGSYQRRNTPVQPNHHPRCRGATV